MRRDWLTAMLALAAVACGGSQPRLSATEEAAVLDVDEATAEETENDDGDDEGLPPRVACYFGELMVAEASGSESNQGALLVKLTMDPARSRMVEDVWSFPLYERWQVTRAVDGSAFTVEQDDGAFVGSGTLSGEAWIWQGWQATTKSADARTTVQTETRFDDGALVTHEKVMNADGSMRFDVRHSLDEIPLDECDNMFAKARANAAEIARAKQQ